ncbi:hypothetical protein XM38_039770 [Halomicronema hongdechloris C2206]|uniref:Uncharacterized protein n=1 Tax=Halomicronema hongdechloris C2206 TaxID=1641165 RepID=A0A1Z3HRU9_9CYAN|nr:hypothetical protein [Halomicronema hongdechloris]ASC73015.1 hypothetical protein XM38_039770 [Halomicronema hongdechloris C2206]
MSWGQSPQPPPTELPLSEARTTPFPAAQSPSVDQTIDETVSPETLTPRPVAPPPAPLPPASQPVQPPLPDITNSETAQPPRPARAGSIPAFVSPRPEPIGV